MDVRCYGFSVGFDFSANLFVDLFAEMFVLHFHIRCWPNNVRCAVGGTEGNIALITDCALQAFLHVDMYIYICIYVYICAYLHVCLLMCTTCTCIPPFHTYSVFLEADCKSRPSPYRSHTQMWHQLSHRHRTRSRNRPASRN